MVAESIALASPVADRTPEGGRRTVARAMWIGLWVWPSFALLDVYMCFVAFPGAPFGAFIGYRVFVELAFIGVYRASRRETTDLKKLFWWQNLCYGAAALAIAVMAVNLGGIRSPYMHGISIVALVRAALVPTDWHHARNTYGRIALAFPLVMGIGAAISPAARAEWLSRESLIVFASNYVFVIASSFLGLMTSHIVWRTQEQLYRARRIGRYRLQAPIGKGAMGEVWLAWDLLLRRNVALKILRAGDVANPDAVRRFEREAQAAAQLRDAHIVQIFDFGASGDGMYYIAMEYLPGMDLGSLVDRSGPLPLARVVKIGMQACLALDESHRAGIIHRDLKPQNLFMTRVGDDPDFVKLLDFGIVRFRVPESASEHLTWTGTMVGTPAYLAPELWTGAEADERSDLYSLGVTLYFLATGESLFETGSITELRALQLSRESPTLTLPDEGEITTALRALLLRCLAWHPEDRVQTARELCDALAVLPSGVPWTREDANAFWRTLDQERFAGSESRR